MTRRLPAEPEIALVIKLLAMTTRLFVIFITIDYAL